MSISPAASAELADKMTMAGIEVEAIEIAQTVPSGIVVAEIRERNPHPNADKLSVCRVFDGQDELQIVCGAPNCDAGKKVPLATIGNRFCQPGRRPVNTQSGKANSAVNYPWECYAAPIELGLSDDHSGLLELDSELIPGTPLNRNIFRRYRLLPWK